MTENLIVFAHGKESGPWGIKIKHLAKTAEQRGFDVISPDYRHTQEPQARIDQLITLRPQARRLVLAGSSMGGYVSAMARSEERRVGKEGVRTCRSRRGPYHEKK